MLDDFDLPGLDDLVDLIGSLWDVLDFDADALGDLDQPTVTMFPGAGAAMDFADPTAFWNGLDGPALDAPGFMAEYGNMQLPNPFDSGVSSPIEDGSYDDLVARTAAITGISVSDFPN